MGKYISLEEAKMQCAVDLDYAGDDALIERYIRSVESTAESAMCRPLSSIEVDGEIPEDLKQGALLLIASYYKNRENEISNGESARQKYGFETHCANYRKYDG